MSHIEKPECPAKVQERDTDGFTPVTRGRQQRQPRKRCGVSDRGTRGRGRGRPVHEAPKPDFSTYHLREAQRQKIVEWLEHSAEDWFCEYMSVPPVMLNPGVAASAIYNKWLSGLVDARVANGLDISTSTSALMYRSCEHARTVLAEHDFLKLVSTFAEPRIIVAAQQARDNPTQATGIPIVDVHYAPFFAGTRPRLVPPYSCMCSDVIVRDDQILGAQQALLAQAQAYCQQQTQLTEPKEGDWWKEMEDDDKSGKPCE